MTTIGTHPAAAYEAGPLPRFGMVWVTWRQHRAALAGVIALFGVFCLLMLVNGLRMRAALSALGLDACHPLTAARCTVQLSVFDNDYNIWADFVPALLQAAPVLAGAFTGAPLLAREFESGTFRFAWTQGTGRTRWAIVKLLLLAAPVAAAAAATSLVFSWWYRPFFAQGRSLMTPQVFDLNGVAFAAWTLAMFAIGALAGVAIRRTVPALAAAIAVGAGLALATATHLRWHYKAPITIRAGLPGGVKPPARSWVQTSWTNPGGRPMSLHQFRTLVEQLGGKSGHTLAWMNQHGYVLWMRYQPESRFWQFQLIESGWLIAAALLAGAATVLLVRRRAG